MEKFTPNSQVAKSAALKVLDTKITLSAGHIIVHGHIINASLTEMDSLVVVADCFTGSNIRVKQADMTISDAHLKPGFMSAFDIATTDDISIDHVELRFKLLFGSEIQCEGITRLQVSRKQTRMPFIDYRITKSIISRPKKN